MGRSCTILAHFGQLGQDLAQSSQVWPTWTKLQPEFATFWPNLAERRPNSARPERTRTVQSAGKHKSLNLGAESRASQSDSLLRPAGAELSRASEGLFAGRGRGRNSARSALDPEVSSSVRHRARRTDPRARLRASSAPIFGRSFQRPLLRNLGRPSGTLDSRPLDPTYALGDCAHAPILPCAFGLVRNPRCGQTSVMCGATASGLRMHGPPQQCEPKHPRRCIASPSACKRKALRLCLSSFRFYCMRLARAQLMCRSGTARPPLGGLPRDARNTTGAAWMRTVVSVERL